MALRTLCNAHLTSSNNNLSIPKTSEFRYGIPFSFVYCTVYQQNIWREGNDQLILEQKRVWRDFFKIIDTGYRTTVTKLNLVTDPKAQVGLVAKFDSLDVRQCWNSKVQGAFKTVDQVVTNPKVIACKVYRKLQPFITKSPQEIVGKNETPTAKTV